jgi:hypothetical protein
VTETPTPEVTETPTPEVTETPTPEVTETPTPEVTETPTPISGAGNVIMSPDLVSVDSGETASFEIRVNTGDQVLGAYGIDITYDSNFLSIASDDDVVKGADGFISAVNINDPGIIRTSGFDTGGAGPGSDLHLLTINMSADEVGTSQIGIIVNTLADLDTETIGIPNGQGGSIIIEPIPTETPTPIPTETPTPIPTETPTPIPTETPTPIPTETPTPIPT